MADDERESKPASAGTRLNRAAQQGQPTHDEKLLASPRPEDTQFLHTDPWRVLRIQSEFVDGFDAMANVGLAVTLFGSARVQPDSPEYAAAVDVARLLGEQGIAIITGGGPGIMEAGNRGARLAGVRSIGLGIELPFEQKLNTFVDRAIEFRYFFARKTMLVKYSEAFVIFPGGFGTMDELFEALTLVQTGKIRNFPIILFGSAYWQGLIDWIRSSMLTGGKIHADDLKLLIVSDSPEEVRDLIVSSIRDESWRLRQEEGARQKTAEVMGSAEA